MKILPYIIGLILLANVFACQRETTYPFAMKQAESLMNTRPDSALYLLQSMADSVSALPEEAQMYYHLLTIQAKDKQYITHTSDSLINSIVSFYENYDDKERLMLAYFYQGSTYRDMNDAPRALKAFHQTIDAGKVTENLTLLGQTYGQMGTLFAYQDLYDEALESKRKALQLYTLQKDSARYPYLNRDIARIYTAKENSDSALYYYKKAQRLALDMGLERQSNNISSELGCLFYNIGKSDTAKMILDHLVSCNPKAYNVFLYLGIIHKEKNQSDSALFYLNKVLVSNDVGQQSTAYLHLSQLADINGDKRKASSLLGKHQHLQDSINAITRTEEMAKYHMLYRFQRAEKENDALELTNEQRQSQIYLLLLSLSITLIIINVILFHLMKKKREIQMQAEKFRKYSLQQKALSTASIKENKERIKQLEMELENSQTQKDTLHSQLLFTQKKLLEIANKQSETTQANKDIQRTLFYKTDIYKRFHKAETGIIKISEDDWSILSNIIEAYYPSFTTHTNALCPSLSEREFNVCLMIKANMTVKGMAIILNCDISAISKIRKRLFVKITGNEGSGKDLDKIIADF